MTLDLSNWKEISLIILFESKAPNIESIESPHTQTNNIDMNSETIRRTSYSKKVLAAMSLPFDLSNIHNIKPIQKKIGAVFHRPKARLKFSTESTVNNPLSICAFIGGYRSIFRM